MDNEEKEKIIQMKQNINRFDIVEILTENVKLKQQLKDIIKNIKEKSVHSNLGYMGRTEKGYYTFYAGVLDDILNEYRG